MPVKESHVPQMCQHKSSGRAFVRIDGRTRYLGRWGSADARDKYAALISQWLANDRTLPQEAATPTAISSDVYTVEALCADYLEFAQGYYLKNGEATKEVGCLKLVIKLWANLFPGIPVADFGPKALKRVRDEMIRMGHTRKTINNQVNRLRRIIAWGVEEEKVKGETLWALRAVKGLRRGRSDAKESIPIRPVLQAVIDAVLPHCNRQVKAMIELQLLTGMRPGEVTIMRPCDISDWDKPTWKYTPQHHKTENHGHIRQIPLGPKARRIVNQFVTTDTQAYLFRPADAVADQRAARREDRQTPLYPSHMNRKLKVEPKWGPGESYSVKEYRNAIGRACDKAITLPTELMPDTVRATWPARKKLKAKMGEKFEAHHAKVLAWYGQQRFHPHQLRHNFATDRKSVV